MRIYQPENPACPDCEKVRGSGFPELQKSTGIRWYCWYCDSSFAKGGDGKYRKIIGGEKSEPADDTGEGENPGAQHKGKQIIGPGVKP